VDRNSHHIKNQSVDRERFPFNGIVMLSFGLERQQSFGNEVKRNPPSGQPMPTRDASWLEFSIRLLQFGLINVIHILASNQRLIVNSGRRIGNQKIVKHRDFDVVAFLWFAGAWAIRPSFRL
jgi:hypothetical protein